jgi:excisionase family DNA binding protein
VLAKDIGAMSAMTREVLTLEEAAGYLRLPEEAMEREVSQGKIPGRLIDRTWRFHKSALDDWLHGQDGRAVLLNQAGALADDDTLARLRDDIYAARGRPETIDGAKT